MRRRSSIPQRKRVFVACEGPSETGYVAFLQMLVSRLTPIPVHIVPAEMKPGYGSPLMMVDGAIKKRDVERGKNGGIAASFLLLDRDRHDPRSDDGRETMRLAEKNDITLIWQYPDHEGHLLRHFPEHRTAELVAGGATFRLLVRRASWGKYAKGAVAMWLNDRLTVEQVRAVGEINPDFNRLLMAIGLAKLPGNGDESGG